MHARLFVVVVGLLWFVVAVRPALAGEPDITGVWQGSLYGSDVRATVEQHQRDVTAVAVVHDLTGGTNVYHFFGVIENGHLVLLHPSGHRFEGDAHDREIVGVLTTKGGSRLEVRAQRSAVQPGGQGSMGQDAARAAHRRS